MTRSALVVRGGWEGHHPVEATELFLPFLRDRAAELQPVPPFTIVTETGDVTRIVVVIGGALVVGVVVVALLLVRAKLAAALRLGEDR